MSGRKYEARIVIFHILAAIDFLGFLGKQKQLRKIGKPLKKVESH